MTRLSESISELNSLVESIGDFYHELALSLNLSDCAFDILYAVVELGDGCLQRDISRMTANPKQTVNSAIKRLVQEGLLRMEAGRGREMQIFLTERGRQYMDERFDSVIRLENAAYSAFTKEEWGEYIRLTRKHLGALRQCRKALAADDERRNP